VNIPKIDYVYNDDGEFLKIEVRYCDEMFVSELRGLSMFLVIGLETLSNEYKSYVNLEVIKGD